MSFQPILVVLLAVLAIGAVTSKNPPCDASSDNTIRPQSWKSCSCPESVEYCDFDTPDGPCYIVVEFGDVPKWYNGSWMCDKKKVPSTVDQVEFHLGHDGFAITF